MCGICGVLSLRGEQPNTDTLKRMTNTIIHRGPDDDGILIDGPCGLGNRRLAIIDLSQSGHMPMSLPAAGVHISYNGEAYNFKLARTALETVGHTFFSGTDTETILRAYAEYGAEKFIEHFNGMFALAIWDAPKKQLVLVRDRMGQKPLYYARTNDWFVFGSEIKTLLAHPAVPKRLNRDTIPYYLAYGYPPAPQTLFEGIHELPPGHMLYVRLEGGESQVEVKRYWQPPFPDGVDDRRTETQVIAALRDLLDRAVRERMIADVPLGAFLSGGLDSAAIVALMAEVSTQPVKTFSIGFEGERSFDETVYAQRIADLFNTEHTVFRVKPDVIELAGMLVHHHDQPFGDSSAIPTYLVSKLAREHVTVALTGDGGDELFAGYDRFYAATLLEKYQRMPELVKTPLKWLVDLLPSGGTGYGNFAKRARRFTNATDMCLIEAYLNWVRYTSPELVTGLVGRSCEADTIAHYEAQANQQRVSETVPYLLDLNMRTYLPSDLLVKIDRCSMAVGLETRSPFLDHQLVEFAAGIRPTYKLKGRTQKYILKQAMRGTLPDNIIDRKKHGFGVPVGYWFRTDLSDYVTSTLLTADARINDILEKDAIKAMVDTHQAGTADLGQTMWTLLTLELWLKHMFG